MRVAIPSEAPGGLDAPVSDHFGHCDVFTLVEVDDDTIGAVTVLDNNGHEQGGCMAPVMFLKKENVEALLAGGMGMRPLSGFQQVGITVYTKEDASTVREAVQLLIDGKCQEFGPAQTCGGGEGHCGDHGHDHSHEPVEREPIEGKADICKDRVVTFTYVVKDPEGNELDATSGEGPAQYLHGYGNIAPGLEKALEGLEAGAHVVVDVPSAEGFGERDEGMVIEVPRDQLPPQASIGSILRAQDDQGHVMQLVVVELGDDKGRLDGNHPLAGQDLVFDVTIVKVEAATPQEIAHGHVH